MSKSILSLLLFCISFTFVYSQGVTLEKARFSTKWEDWGPRLVAGKLYCLSASFDGDSTMNDPYTLKPFSDLYVLINDTLIQHATFSTVTFGVNTSMSSNFYDGPVSGNDTIMFFTNNHGYDHNVRLGVFYAYKRNNQWIDALVFPFNSLAYNVSHPFYDEKNGKLYFVSDKDSVERNQDIYVCTFDGKSFGIPTKLEQTRTPLNEVTPLIYKDTLYFASNRTGTMGGYDMYKLVNDQVVSLGPDFNSTFDDLGLMYDSDTSGYFTSDRYSKGADDDIVRFNIHRERPAPEVAQNQAEDTPVIAVLTNQDALKQLVASKKAVDSLKQVALQAGVSPDIFAFLNLAMAPFETNFPASFNDKSIPEIKAKDAQLQTIRALIQQQIDLLKPKAPLMKAPIANNDLITVPENTPVLIDALGNDSAQVGKLDPNSIDLDPTKPGIQQNSTTPQGTWSANNGKVTFKPVPGFTGPASIPYTVSDQNGTPSDPALISVNITPVVTPPVANNDQATTTPNRPVVLPIMNNDSSPNSRLNAQSIDLDPNSPGQQTTFVTPQGAWSVQDGQLTFAPVPKFTGNAYIPYTIKDIKGVESNVANVTVQVGVKQDLANLPTNGPIANNDIAFSSANRPVTLDILKNDTDPTDKLDPSSVDLDPNTPGIQKFLNTPQGTWTVDNGVVTFQPLPQFLGQASLPYTVQNTKGIPSNIGVITVKVDPIKEAPIANNDYATTLVGEPVKIPVSTNDIANVSPLNLASIDLNPSTPGIQTKLSNPQGTWSVTNGIVSFVPASNFVGKASIPYTVKDQKGTPSNTALISVEVANKTIGAAPSEDELAIINSIIDQSKIENIHFEFDKYDITPEFKTYLRGLSMLFQANPAWQIHLSGHTDGKGSASYNITLSKNRAKSAKAFLESCGINGERITYEYHGLEKPIATNSTDEGRYENRRVEIAVFLNGKTLYSTGE